MAQSALRALTQQLMQGGPVPAGMASAQTAIQNAAQRPQPKPMGQQVADVLGGVALPLSTVPVVGDIAGLGADAAMYANYPEERTALNYGMTLAGMLPFVPGAAGVRTAEGALDMSQAARMQRAQEMGFSPETVYHGTSRDIDEFQPKQFGGGVTRAGSAKMGTWFADNPEVAATYARYAAEDVPVRNILEQADRAGRSRNFDEQERLYAIAEQMELGGQLRNAGGQNIIPARLRGNLMEIDVEGATMSDLDESQLLNWAREAQSKGMEGLKISNFSDNADYGQYIPATHYLIFDPSNIRSVNADFDPAKRGSANLSAGVMGGAVGLSALRQLMPQQEQE